MKIVQFRGVIEQIEKSLAADGDRDDTYNIIATLKSGVTMAGAWGWLNGSPTEIIRLGDNFIDLGEVAAITLLSEEAR